MFEFRLPDLGEGIHEGELLKWYVKEGDFINEEDSLCDMETDKAAVTIPSPRTGTIVTLNGKPGDTINVDDILVVIDDGSDNGTGPGDDEQKGQKDPEPKESAKTDKQGKKPSELNIVSKKAVAAPAIRRLAREMGIDINGVSGTGPAGRVTRDDLLNFSEGEEVLEDGSPAPSTDTAYTPADSFESSSIPFFEISKLPPETGEFEEVEIRSLRKKVAVKTTSSKIMIPHVAHMEEIDVSNLEDVRKEYNKRYGESDKLTMLAFIAKAVASLLKSYPEFNSVIDLSKMVIRLKKYYNIGFAADTKRGLVVPVIHGADQKNLADLGKSIKNLSVKAREGKIEVSDLTGGTFTITNVGALGGTYVFPVINYPESAILGMGSVKKKPVVIDDSIVIRKILPVSLCFDHRIADGAQAARFMGDLKGMLEDSLKFMAWI